MIALGLNIHEGSKKQQDVPLGAFDKTEFTYDAVYLRKIVTNMTCLVYTIQTSINATFYQLSKIRYVKWQTFLCKAFSCIPTKLLDEKCVYLHTNGNKCGTSIVT